MGGDDHRLLLHVVLQARQVVSYQEPTHGDILERVPRWEMRQMSLQRPPLWAALGVAQLGSAPSCHSSPFGGEFNHCLSASGDAGSRVAVCSVFAHDLRRVTCACAFLPAVEQVVLASALTCAPLGMWAPLRYGCGAVPHHAVLGGTAGDGRMHVTRVRR